MGDKEKNSNFDVFDSKHYEYGFLRYNLSKFVVGSLISIFRFQLRYLNNFKFYGDKEFQEFLDKPRERGVLTISNHTSTLDDPTLMSNLVSSKMIFNQTMLRFSICAKDMCFKNRLLSETFFLFKALPIERGGGTEQRGMEIIYKKLKEKNWVHIFPEGRISQTGVMNPIKRGVSRIILETNPIVLPFYHEGMDKVLPVKTYIPHWKKSIFVIFDKAMYFDEIVEKYNKGLLSMEEAEKIIIDRITEKFGDLQKKLQNKKEEKSE